MTDDLLRDVFVPSIISGIGGTQGAAAAILMVCLLIGLAKGGRA